MRKESFRVGLEEIGTAALSGRERGGFKTAGQAESGFKLAGRVNKGARSTDQRGDNGGAQIEKEGKPAEEKEQQRGVAFAQGNHDGVSVARERTARK